MSNKVKVMVLRTAGTNCDQETAHAFQACGATVASAHINLLLQRKVSLSDYHILALPGGFTYGDDIESGRILANELRVYLKDEIKRFIDSKKLIIGICNGFQILVKAGFLPGDMGGAKGKVGEPVQNATLFSNDSGKFEDRWVHLKRDGRCVWTDGMPEKVFLPVAHAEGKFIPANTKVSRSLQSNGQIIFRYCNAAGGAPVYPDCPNGSVDNIAGITDATGHILGLMPHPERHFLFHHHPQWTRFEQKGELGDGAAIFQNGVNYVKRHL